MRFLLQLSLKELKDHQGLFLVFAGATFFAEGYALSLKGGSLSDQFSSLILSFLPLPLAGLLLPFFLAKSFTNEWKEGTHLFLLTLPVPRFQIGLSKVLTFYGFSLFLFIITMSGSHLTMKDNSLIQTLQLNQFSSGFYIQRSIQGFQNDLFPSSEKAISLKEETPLNLWKIWVSTGMVYCSLVGLFLGLATLCESLKYSVRKFRFWIAFLTFNLGTYLYFKLYPAMPSLALSQISSSELIPQLHNTRDLISSEMLLFGVYTIAMGIFFLVVGLWIFEKKTEV